VPSTFIIIGVSGAGKTTVAQEMESRGDLVLHDFEDVFAELVGEDASTYLVRNGEKAYEAEALKVARNLLDQEGVVVLAPGVVREDEIRNQILKKRDEGAVVVELFADTSTLMRRTGLNAPRSVALGPTRRILTEMVSQYRESYEGLADLVIDTSLSKPQYVADRILAFEA
jgi:shikimate kinase